jgi:diguanylate cyclase (GGDEF)-like protein
MLFLSQEGTRLAIKMSLRRWSVCLFRGCVASGFDCIRGFWKTLAVGIDRPYLEFIEHLGTRARIVLLAIASALPAIAYAVYLLLTEEVFRPDALGYGLAAIAAIAVVILIACYGEHRLIQAPIRKMLETTRRVTAGDLQARTGLKHSDSELAELGGELDVMTERLELRDRELRRTLAELEEKALTDPLTGLYNRRFFDDALTRRFVEARRDPAPFSVIMLDLDHFKSVNDTYGHDAGDHVLREISHVIGRSIRGSDIAARYGGEEFTVLMPYTTLAVAQERAELLRRQIQRVDIRHGGHRVKVTASLGVVQSAEQFEDSAALMKAVDLTVYEAKSRGRNCVVLGGIEGRERAKSTASRR